MTRLEKAVEVLKEHQTERIVRQLCPECIDKELPYCDKNTFTRYTNYTEGTGCRGITCEQCWNKELN